MISLIGEMGTAIRPSEIGKVTHVANTAQGWHITGPQVDLSTCYVLLLNNYWFQLRARPWIRGCEYNDKTLTQPSRSSLPVYKRR